MPNSAVMLRLDRNGIEAELTLPIGELAIGWEKPLPLDSVGACAIRSGTEDYIRAHVRPLAPTAALDMRSGAGDLLNEQEFDVRVELMMTPPGAPVDRLTLRSRRDLLASV